MALAALLTGENGYALKATILVVVVLTVIIFGGTTARMLEILGIRTGVVEEIDSDDEFDIESFGTGLHAKRSGAGIGYIPRRNGTVPLNNLEAQGSASYVSGHSSPHGRPTNPLSRKNSVREFERADLLARQASGEDSDIGSDIDTSDLPPPARRSPLPRASPQPPAQADSAFMSPSGDSSANAGASSSAPITAAGAIRQLWQADDPAGLFRQLDEDYIKPKLLLHGDGGRGGGNGGNGSG